VIRYTTTTCGKRKVRGSTVRRIRKYYAHYIAGYFHNPVTNELQLFDGSNIDNTLSYTCKRIAQEIDRLALQLNTITFRTHLSLPKGIDIPSDTNVFEDLIRQRKVALIRIIRFSYTLVTSDILHALCDR
jgi:hypothetical protein